MQHNIINFSLTFLYTTKSHISYILLQVSPFMLKLLQEIENYQLTKTEPQQERERTGLFLKITTPEIEQKMQNLFFKL